MAWLRAQWFWPFAMVPCLFAMQQAAEGVVWLGLLQPNEMLVTVGSGVFLFFAIAFWPTWFSLAATLVESNPRKRTVLTIWTIVSTVWFFAIYLPLLGVYGPPAAQIVERSVRYEYADTGGLWPSSLALWIQRGAYALSSALPILICSANRLLRVPLVLSLVSFIVSAVLYDHAFTSVWCFWSALVSGLLAWSVSWAPAQPPGTPAVEFVVTSSARPAVLVGSGAGELQPRSRND